MGSVKKAEYLLTSIFIVMAIPLVFWAITGPAIFVSKLGIYDYSNISLEVWFFTLALSAGYVGYTAAAVPAVRADLLRLTPLKFLGIGVAITSGVLEELLFRHLFMDWLLEAGYDSGFQIVASGVLFGLIHLVWYVNRKELSAMFPIFLATSLLGTALACLYIISGRVLLPCIVAHVAINLLIEPWLLLASVSGDWNGAGIRGGTHNADDS